MRKLTALLLALITFQALGEGSVVKWICATNRVEDDIGVDRYLRSTLVVSEGLMRATAHLYIDDGGMLKVDGVKVGRYADSANWTRYFQAPGKHLVEVTAKNAGGPGGVCFALELEYENGKREHFHTDGTWEASLEGKNWFPAIVRCDALSGSWTRVRNMKKFLTPEDAENLRKRQVAVFQTKLEATMAIIQGETKPQSRIRYDRGRARIDIGGKLYEPTYYNTSANWNGENFDFCEQVAAFRDAGVHLYGLGIRVADVWKGPNEYDFSKLTAPMESALSIDPDARFMYCLAQTIAPKWWVETHPDELVGYAGGVVNPKEKNDIRNVATASMASEVWKADFAAFIKATIEYLETTEFSKRIFAYRVDYGIHQEWHYHGMRDWLWPDNGKAMTVAFRKFTGDASAMVPGKEERENGGSASAPRSERVIAYERCHAAVIRDAVLSADKAAKKACGGRCLVGNYCGYFFGMDANIAEGWHLENDAILDSPDVDFQASPQVYGPSARLPGNPQYARCLLEGLRRRGKLALLEADNAPSRAPTNYCKFSKDRQEDEALLARDFASTLCWGCGFWYFDFGNGWYGKEFADFFSKIFPIRSRDADCRSVSEVLVVGDYESVMYTCANREGLKESGRNTTRTITALGHAGVPFDTASLKDLLSGRLKKYKLYVLCNLCKERRNAVMKAMRNLQSGKMLFKAPQSVAEWKAELKKADVHIYNHNEQASFYANAGYVALHVGKAGQQQITLPRKCFVKELYPECKVIGEVDEIVFESQHADTFIFGL